MSNRTSQNLRPGIQRQRHRPDDAAAKRLIGYNKIQCERVERRRTVCDPSDIVRSDCILQLASVWLNPFRSKTVGACGLPLPPRSSTALVAGPLSAPKLVVPARVWSSV